MQDDCGLPSPARSTPALGGSKAWLRKASALCGVSYKAAGVLLYVRFQRVRLGYLRQQVSVGFAVVLAEWNGNYRYVMCFASLNPIADSLSFPTISFRYKCDVLARNVRVLGRRENARWSSANEKTPGSYFNHSSHSVFACIPYEMECGEKTWPIQWAVLGLGEPECRSLKLATRGRPL